MCVKTMRSTMPDFDARIVVIGLQNAGKTTFLKRIKEPTKPIKTRATMGVNVETYKIDSDSRVAVYDIGGQSVFAEHLWEPHLRKCDGVIWVLDSADPLKMVEARKWLDKVNDWIQQEAVFCFIVNKKDLPNTLSFEEIIAELHLERFMMARPRSFGLYLTSAKFGDGVEEAWEWFTEKVLQQKETERIHLKNIVLFTDFGVPLAAATMGGTEVDSAIFSGFFSAISSFGSQVFSQTEHLADITFGNHRIVFESKQMDILKTKHPSLSPDRLICAAIVDKLDSISQTRSIAKQVVNWASTLPEALSDENLLEFLSKTFKSEIPILKPQAPAPLRVMFAFSQVRSALRIDGIQKLTNLSAQVLEDVLEQLVTEGVIIKKKGGWYVPKSQITLSDPLLV